MPDHRRAIRSRVGNTIRRLRLQRDLSQERLAELSGRTWKHVGQIERGEVNVGLNVLADIASALSVDVSALFAESAGRRRPAHASDYAISRDQLQGIKNIIRAVESPRPRYAARKS